MKNIRISLIIIVFARMVFTTIPNPLVGRWQQKLPGGAMALVIYRPDNSYDAFVNGKAFVSGNYYVGQDTVRLSDAFCNPNYRGTYKLDFFAEDSVRFIVVQDTCRRRRMGTNGLTIGRIKPDRVKPSK